MWAQRCFGSRCLAHFYAARFFVDKEDQGFLTWAKTVRGYKAPPESKSAFTWDPRSRGSLAAIGDAITSRWLTKFITHLSQEGAKAGTTSSVDLRLENILFIKSLCEFCLFLCM